ncbi:MAG: Crp/Fnr family transcriptional regulator [Bacteroidetes bacterium]|nr:Crp/Fnr family transcriptional regulator [Bacteroidota bacterium]
MTFDLIIQNVSRYISLTREEEGFFISMLQSGHAGKKTFLLQEGEVCRYTYFVMSGCLRGYSNDKNGVEHTLIFAPRDWWISDIYSAVTQKPGMLNIEAIEDTELLMLSNENRELLFTRLPKFERFFRILVEKSLVNMQQRILDNMSLTAEERYQSFCTRYPGLADKLTSKQIASYIGVTPEFYSKMRARLAKKS